MKRSPLPSRRQPLARSKKPNKVNRKRKASEFARCYGSKERVEFVKSLPCICATTKCSSCRDNAHIRGDGAGRKADYALIVPLCRYHHLMLHDKGVNWFENVYGTDLEMLAAHTEQAWQEYSGTSNKDEE